MRYRIAKMLALLPIVAAGIALSPVYAQEYQICLTEERSDWTDFGVPRRRFESFHVVPDEDDLDERLLQAIVNGMQTEGLTVTVGSLAEVPDDAEIVITFEANWKWDLGMKLHESVIFFRDASTHRVLLVANQFGHFLAAMPTVEMARMINRLNSADLATPLCWNEEPDV